MSLNTFPKRAQIERACDLDFTSPAAPSAGQAIAITIELAPDGVHIHCAYQGTLASIPAAVKRLQDAGLLELVNTHRAAPAAAPAKAKVEPVEPLYRADGTACCPVHKTPLTHGQFGQYCSSRAKPGEAQNAKGYCSLRFAE